MQLWDCPFDERYCCKWPSLKSRTRKRWRLPRTAEKHPHHLEESIARDKHSCAIGDGGEDVPATPKASLGSVDLGVCKCVLRVPAAVGFAMIV
jgi:hypothetical protein